MIGVAQGIIGVGVFSARLRRPGPAGGSRSVLVLVDQLGAHGVLRGRRPVDLHDPDGGPDHVRLLLAPAANAVTVRPPRGETTPRHLQARVVSVFFLAATTAASFAPLAAGLLIQHVTGKTAMELCALAAAGSAVAATLGRGMR